MPKTYIISAENAAEIEKVRKTISDKKVDRRLQAVQLRGEGMTNHEIADKLDTSAKMVSHWISTYINGGNKCAAAQKAHRKSQKFKHRRRKRTSRILCQTSTSRSNVDLNELKAKYIEKVGHSIGGSQIYRMLKRHGWRKIMPRSKHPKKANDEAIEASKKLKPK